MQRCFWANESELMQVYHDEEWGTPVYDDRELFERLILEGFQAGLSWRTILHKRENFRRAFDGFDPERMARYDEAKIAALLADPGIVRNRLKVRGAVRNAQAFLSLVEQQGSFSDWLWDFVGGEPLLPSVPRTSENLPAETPLSRELSRALKKAGFTFVGPTICYAFMQSVGMVNDHVIGCFRYQGPR
ncbi:MAG: DNA-3-methyladenine glycosylase I [Caldilineae bacterium]|nr:MAG: DNA-3-methyladenine glycosylase I [Caldilineae bacterium]